VSRAKASVRSILEAAAAGLPAVTTDVACKGTALEARTYKVHDKAFLFLGAKDARLKLGASLAEARRLAGDHPESIRVGAGGWTTLRLADAPAPGAALRRWVRESHDLFAGGPGSSRRT